MLVVVNGFSVSGVGGSATGPSVPLESISIDERMNDPLPMATFDILDPGSQSTYAIGNPVIIWDENAPPQGTTPTVPAHNLLGKAVYFLDNTYWVEAGTLSGLITRSTASFSMTFANNAAGGNDYLQQITQLGYCYAGQTYMLSAYLTISAPLTNAVMFMQLQFLNAKFQQVGSTAYFSTGSTTNNVRESIQATAPYGAVYIQVLLGGQTTASTNSGTGQWATPQLEPMWFVNEGITYPTPDCNYNQSNCARCADDTISRACRLFAGYINDLGVTYDGPNRTWHVSCAGPGALLENSLVSHAGGTFSDSTIINDTLNNYFLYQGYSVPAPVYTLLSNTAVNTFAPSPVQTIASSVTGQWTDISFRSMLNDLVGVSGGQYYVDWYYNLYYQPIYNQTAGFTLTDTPGYATAAVEYSFTRSITILHSQVSGGQNLSNFPVLISFTDTTMKTVANGGYVQSSSGYDIIFMDATQQVQLAHELESYNASTGKIVAWVNVPTVSASADTVIYLCWGNASVTSPTATPALVWDSNYVGVWHLEDNAANTTIVDSTANANNATNHVNTSTKTTTGEIDGALTYNGTSDFSSVPLNLSGTSTITVSFWLNWTTFANNDKQVMEFTSNYTSSTGGFLIDPNSSTYSGNVEVDYKGSNGTATKTFSRPSAGAFHAYTIVLDKTQDDNSQITIYLDGSLATTTLQSTATSTGDPFANSTLYWMSRAGSSNFGAGTLDEVRLSTGIRPPNWIATEYNNQSAPGSFISLGSVTNLAVPQVNETAYPYYNYRLQYDGTQIKNVVKVVGDSSSHVAKVIGQNVNQVMAPPYVTPPFTALVTDSNLTSVAACTSRGLAELAQYENPRVLIKLTCQHYTQAGTVINLTSTKDGIINQGFVVQSVKGKCLGNGINEYEYDLGSFNPTIIDHLRRLTKTVSQPTQTSTTNPGATDIAFYETMFYGESVITFTPHQSNPGVYGTARYSIATYS